MATLEPICEQEWERHKNVLQGMYCKENLPLLNRKGNCNEPGVVQLMKERHGFSASPSQYELQFKKWGFTKNLKSSEWSTLIAQYDRLRQTKSDVRITVCGSVLNKTKIDKARRRYRLNHNDTQGAVNKDSTLQASRHAHVEFLDDSGKWTRYCGSQGKNPAPLIRRKSSHVLGNTSPEVGKRPVTPHVAINPCLLRDERPFDILQLQNESLPVYQPFSPILNVDEVVANPTFNSDDRFFSGLSSISSTLNCLYSASELCPNTPVASVVSTEISFETTHQEVALERPASAAIARTDCARDLITSVIEHFKMSLCSKKNFSTHAKIPDVEDIMESLDSLLPDAPSRECPDLTLGMRSASPSFQFFETLLYSFRNNFAGLRHVPRASIMRLIREHHSIRNHLFDVIKGGLPGVAKPLADSFFRAAVEGNDANAVATIIHHTKSNPAIAINPNEIVCNIGDENFTPIELAAGFRNRELVLALLSSGADPNKTYQPVHKEWLPQGALAHALGRWDHESQLSFEPLPPNNPEPVELCLLKLLLDFGAEVRIDLAENAMRPGPGHSAIAEELMSRIPARKHQICFESEWLLVGAIQYLENSAADKILKRLFLHCSESEDCGKCVSEHPLLIEKLLCHSARRGYLDLTKFLAQHTSQLQSGMAAAIRSSSNELVEFLLSKGARVDAPVQPWHRCSYYVQCPELYDEDGYDRLRHLYRHGRQNYVITPIRTPLAEAIRSRNNQMLRTCERLGAFARLSDEHHFHAAVLAAVEVGDLCSLKTILNHASIHNKGSDLTHALAVAIRNDETDAAIMLLDAGANLKNPIPERRYGIPLIMALEQSNRRVVDSMLECDVEIPGKFNSSGKLALEAAAAWGDVELVIDLMRAGANIDEGVKITPLGAAVRTGDKTFVSQMLDLGADPKATLDDPDVVTPLKAAMETGDYDMVRFLISKGVPPTDSSALLYAMSHDPVGYEILLTEFKTQHPRGLPGFGARLLAQAIELGSRPLMESLLRAGVDMNSWCETNRTCKGVSESMRRPPLSVHKRRVLGLAITQLKSRNLELIGELLDQGADTNLIVYEFECKSSSGSFTMRETPLLLAIQSKRFEVVRLLLEHGAEVNRPARRGVKQTPLQAACETGSYSMVEFLLQKGARVNDAPAERYGGTALQLAAKSGSLKIVSLLLDNGANAFTPRSKVGGRTAFEAAAESGCIDVLGQLWNAVLPLGFSEKECQSAKKLAREGGHGACADFIDFLSGVSSQSFLNG